MKNGFVISIAFLLLMSLGSASAQHPAAQQQKTAEGLATEITAAFPEAATTKKVGKWIEVYDAKKNLLGYVLYSKPASDGIKGYMGETPLLIAFNSKKTIVSVQLLDNSDTPGYVRKVISAGLLNSWNGLTAANAAKKKVDAVSGATYTSRGIIQSLQAALQTF